MIDNLSVVHQKYKDKDPRTIPYLYPETINIVAYAKNVQAYSLFATLDVAEQIAKRFGHLLVHSKCMHWSRIKKYVSRRVRVGRRTYYILKPSEMTDLEIQKLKTYVDELQNSSIYDHKS